MMFKISIIGLVVLTFILFPAINAIPEEGCQPYDGFDEQSATFSSYPVFNDTACPDFGTLIVEDGMLDLIPTTDGWKLPARVGVFLVGGAEHAFGIATGVLTSIMCQFMPWINCGEWELTFDYDDDDDWSGGTELYGVKTWVYVGTKNWQQHVTPEGNIVELQVSYSTHTEMETWQYREKYGLFNMFSRLIVVPAEDLILIKAELS